MRHMIRKLWDDDGGALLAVEWLFLATILVLGIIVGMVGVRDFVNSGLQEFANATGALSQSYSFCGQAGCCSSTTGSEATDVAHTFAITRTTPINVDISSPPCG
jgi:Flp pilus assembly pilin Flp